MSRLNSIRVFEVVARHESIKRAAEELHLTPGAVGQQIKQLEAWLGVELFRRHAKMIRITELGREYYSRIRPAIAEIDDACRFIRAQRHNSVSLSLVPSLAARWLVGRLDNFISTNPDVDIVIEASTRFVNFDREPVDMAIRYFDGKDPTLLCELLHDGHSVALCTPEYKERVGLNSPNDMARATILHTPLHAQWPEWFDRYTTISESDRESIREVRCNEITLAVDAAKRHLGVVLSTPLLFAREIASGELIEPFPNKIASAKSYYLVHPVKKKLSPAALILRNWILDQFADIRKNTGLG
ncbi:MAG TPA: LysR substrate-binding domain-containing protein [Amaricoccus sp.]|uniref:LysR substrate-binding domain-containing protein n=1 Tax=Amaricoccus sp. TaxID=1872485 RepID=UPI002D0912B8|nr:LysR substrate-binding domain-containing protein [Amaricoccus sp.]HMU00276.1 LysR substrate-binding domain-containing protein [Amaricoccus sp.]